MIAIIDYGMGNLRSVQKAFERLGVTAAVTADPGKIRDAKKLILPGVGHFAQGMENLNKTGLSGLLHDEVMSKGKPILGICLGMQLLTNHSEEGDAKGLGFVDAQTIHFPEPAPGLHIPHMGWNEISPAKESQYSEGLNRPSLMYFVHTYYVKCVEAEDVLFRTRYGIEFDSAFLKDHIAGFQFHPEKSHRPGLELIRKFIGN
jgi:glutamine amidotransferase